MEIDPTKLDSNAAKRWTRADAAVAATVPDHTLIRVVGEGAYGEVWLARNVMGTYRAVKIVYRSSFNSDEPYEREFNGIRRYEPVSRTNTGLVDILQVGRNDDKGYFYYVMELADGAGVNGRPESSQGEKLAGNSAPGAMDRWSSYAPRTLRSEVERRGQLPAAECVPIGRSLCQALAHLHSRNLLHRDIKPSNLIFVDGAVKLADIGLVTEETAARTFVGTEGFIPPEGPNSKQADLFSLGMVLYELSSGKKAKDFPEPSPAMVKGPERAALLELNAIILKACAAHPGQRYASAEEMDEELALLERGRSVVARHARQRMRLGAQRVGLTLAAVLAVGTAGFLLARKPAHVSSASTRLRIEEARFWLGGPLRPRSFDVAPDGKRIVFSGPKGLWLWDADTLMNRHLQLTGFGSYEAPAPRGEWEVPRVMGTPRWAPDGKHFVFQAYRTVGGTLEGPTNVWALFLVDPQTAQTHQMTSEFRDDERLRDLCWLPDGKAVTAIDFQRHLYTVTLAGGRTLWVDAHLPGRETVGLSGYSPDGNWLLFYGQPNGKPGRFETDIWLMPHGGGRAVPLVQRPGTDAFPTWGPDGDTVFFASNGGFRMGNTWALWKVGVDLRTGAPKEESQCVFTTPGQRIHHPRFVADGQRLLYGVERTDQTILRADSDSLNRFVPLFRGGHEPVCSPDGQTVYFVGEQKDNQGIYAIDGRGSGALRQLSRLIPLTKPIAGSGLSLSPDGAQLALFSYDENQKRFGVFLVPVVGGDAVPVYELPEYDAIVPVWSPDGQWLALALDENLYRVSRDGSRRELLATLYRWQEWSVRWSPDGQHIAALAYASPQEWEEEAGVFVVDVGARNCRKLSPDSEDKYKEGLEWHPSSQFLTYMFYGPERFSAQIRRAYLDGRPTDLMIDQQDHWDYVGVWEPGGQSFIFTSNECKGPGSNLHRYEAATGEITHAVGSGSLPSWSRDTKTVVWSSGREECWLEELEFTP